MRGYYKKLVVLKSAINTRRENDRVLKKKMNLLLFDPTVID
jgi:hypothetical protein